MTFKIYNHNPLGKKHADCVFNAIGKAFDKSWDEVYDELCRIGKEKKSSPNFKVAYEEYLKDFQTIPVMHINYCGVKKRYTVKEVSQWCGTYLVQIANHMTCVKNGVIYDNWDCSRKSTYKIWRIK